MASTKITFRRVSDLRRGDFVLSIGNNHVMSFMTSFITSKVQRMMWTMDPRSVEFESGRVVSASGHDWARIILELED